MSLKVITHISSEIKAEEALEGGELSLWSVLVVDTAAMHHALPVEQLQVARDKDPVCFKRLIANLLAVLRN